MIDWNDSASWQSGNVPGSNDVATNSDPKSSYVVVAPTGIATEITARALPAGWVP